MITSNTKFVVERLNKLPAKTTKLHAAVLTEMAQEIVKNSRTNTPVDTGRLRDSHTYRPAVVLPGGVVLGEVSVGDNKGGPAWNAHIIHNDASRSGSSHFLENAVEAQAPIVHRRLDKAVKSAAIMLRLQKLGT